MTSKEFLDSASPVRFLFLTLILSIPWWLLSQFVSIQGLPDRLPITDAGAVFMPALAAVLLTYRTSGWQGVGSLLRRLVDGDRLRASGWFICLALPTAFYLLVAVTMGFLGFDLPTCWNIGSQFPLVFLVFALGAIAEEIGYTAYATDPLLKRFSPTLVGIMLGIPWALWHLPSMIQIGQSTGLIAWGLFATVAFRVIYVQLYSNLGRSVFSIVLLHALFNAGRVAFPGGRDGFEQGDAMVGYVLVVTIAIILSLIWERVRFVS